MKRRGRVGSIVGRRRWMCRIVAVEPEEPERELSGGM